MDNPYQPPVGQSAFVGPSFPEKYWAYWKRGWWAWLMMLCSNIGGLLAFIPLAIYFGRDPGMYLFSAFVAWLLLGAPFLGWLFERFAGASDRIGVPDQDFS